jgi:ethanolamine ammonia-lyase small subunit
MTKPPVSVHPGVAALAALRRFTPARIALGRTGVSVPTAAQLEFQLAHARARDAVHRPFDVQALANRLDESPALQPLGRVLLESRTTSRVNYLQRPDLGRRLSHASAAALREAAPAAAPDLAIVMADGLSSLAMDTNAVGFLEAVVPGLRNDAFAIAPLCLVTGGRVAIGDEVGELLRARIVVVLIGERPGLTSPDSLGAYLTHSPRVGLTDECRNCLSNVREAGLPWEAAAERLRWLLNESRRRGLSGVALKEDAPALSSPPRGPALPAGVGR